MRARSKPFLGVEILTERGTDAKALVRVINATRIGRVVFFSRIRTPQILASNTLQEIRESKCKVVVVAADPKDSSPMIQAVNLLSMSTLNVSVFAYGEMDPMTVVQVMRQGAREYLGRPTSPQDMNEAFVRLLQPPPDDDIALPFTPLPPDSGPPRSAPPSDVLVGVPRPRGPKTLPSRKAVPEEFGWVFRTC